MKAFKANGEDSGQGRRQDGRLGARAPGSPAPMDRAADLRARVGHGLRAVLLVRLERAMGALLAPGVGPAVLGAVLLAGAVALVVVAIRWLTFERLLG